MARVLLFENQASNGSGPGRIVYFNSPEAEIFVWGVMGGATLTLETSPDNGASWLPVPDDAGVVFSITATGVYGDMTVAYGEMLRATLTGGDGTMNVSVSVQSIRQ